MDAEQWDERKKGAAFATANHGIQKFQGQIRVSDFAAVEDRDCNLEVSKPSTNSKLLCSSTLTSFRALTTNRNKAFSCLPQSFVPT